MSLKLRPFQRKGVRLLRRFGGRALLADEMGLGKTVQALRYVRRIFRKVRGYKQRKFHTIVVCPAGVKYNWEREAVDCGLHAQVIEGTKPAKWKGRTLAPVLIINYDILSHWLKFLKRLKPQIVLLDECQYIQNRRAKRTVSSQVLCRGVERVVALSGTPLTNRPAELWTVLNILWPKKFSSFFSYAMRYCKPERKPWGWEYKGATNLKHLHRRLKRLGMIRRLKRDVLEELPEKSRFVVPLYIGAAGRREYAEAFNNFILWLAKQSKRKALRARKAERMVKVGYLKRLAAQLKLAAVFDWIDRFLVEDDGKLIFFAIHKRILKQLRKRYPGIHCFIDGSVHGKKRQHAIDEFKNVKRKRIMFAQLDAACAGWNGQVASTVAVGELGWKPGVMTQAEDRAHRMGQRKNVSCYYLVAQGTIEEDLCSILQVKQSVITQTLDGEDHSDDLDIFDLLCKRLRHKAKKSKRKAA